MEIISSLQTKIVVERVGGGRGRGTHSSRRQTQGGPLHPIPRSLFLLLLYFISKTKQKRGGGRGVTEGWFENRTKLTKYERQNHKRSQKWISDRSMTYPTRPVCCWNFDSSSPPPPTDLRLARFVTIQNVFISSIFMTLVKENRRSRFRLQLGFFSSSFLNSLTSSHRSVDSDHRLSISPGRCRCGSDFFACQIRI